MRCWREGAPELLPEPLSFLPERFSWWSVGGENCNTRGAGGDRSTSSRHSIAGVDCAKKRRPCCEVTQSVSQAARSRLNISVRVSRERDSRSDVSRKNSPQNHVHPYRARGILSCWQSKTQSSHKITVGGKRTSHLTGVDWGGPPWSLVHRGGGAYHSPEFIFLRAPSLLIILGMPRLGFTPRHERPGGGVILDGHPVPPREKGLSLPAMCRGQTQVGPGSGARVPLRSFSGEGGTAVHAAWGEGASVCDCAGVPARESRLTYTRGTITHR